MRQDQGVQEHPNTGARVSISAFEEGRSFLPCLLIPEKVPVAVDQGHDEVFCCHLGECDGLHGCGRCGFHGGSARFGDFLNLRWLGNPQSLFSHELRHLVLVGIDNVVDDLSSDAIGNLTNWCRRRVLIMQVGSELLAWEGGLVDRSGVRSGERKAGKFSGSES